MKKINLLNNLVVVALFLAILNLVLTFDLYEKLGYFSKKAVEGQNTNQPTDQPAKVQVSADDDPVKGSKASKVTIIEFGDFQCPYCGVFFKQVLPELESRYIETGKAKLVYRDLPLSFHQYAQKAAEAAECADEQGKFWLYHDKIFENQNSLETTSLKRYAADLKLEATKFNQCLDSGKMASEVQKDLADGQKYGVSGTPSFFINGTILEGAQPFSDFEKIIEQELKK